METFSFPPTKNLPEKRKWLLSVTFFETTNSVVTLKDANKSFSCSTPIYWTPDCGEEPINKLNKLLELRSQNQIELYVKEVIGDKRYSNRRGKQR